MKADVPYQELETRWQRLSALSAALSLLSWDRATMMPEGSAESRAETMATLQVMRHGLATAPDMGDLIEAAEQDAPSMDEWQKANLREMRRSWEQATLLSPELVDALSRASSRAEMVWRSARPADDFAALAPHLNELVALTREAAESKAEHLGCAPYEALVRDYDPGRRVADIDRLFDELLAFLPGAVDDALARQASGPPALRPEGPFPSAAQEGLGRTIMKGMGFDFDRGRLDTSHHPFCGGMPGDIRITTRYDEADFTSSLMAVVHETGHALYESGLPEAWMAQPVGRSRGMTLHESQSLLFEMQAARTPQFISHLATLAAEELGGSGPAWSADNLTRLYHQVARSLIRVDADEVTYPLHVILRYRLERAMVEGDLAVADLPGAWREGMAELVGVAPDNDREGCLQDIHWPSGGFGYFPTYTLGALTAAQIFRAACAAHPEIPDRLARGDFAPLLAFVRSRIHARASLLMPDALIEEATGEPLGADAFKAHVAARYLS